MVEVAKAENMEGYLFKLGGKGKKWKKRYVVLDGDKMEYFTKEGAGKVHGAINLSEGRGVREMGQCQCKWPKGVTEELGFGLAMESRTFYFHAIPGQSSVREWKSKIQSMVEIHGRPDTNWQDDHKGKPEGSKSKISRGLASAGSKVTKQAIKHAPVSSKVKNSVGAGMDMVAAQADADPNASVGQRLAMGVGGTASVVGATGVGGDTGKAVMSSVKEGAKLTNLAFKKRK